MEKMKSTHTKQQVKTDLVTCQTCDSVYGKKYASKHKNLCHSLSTVSSNSLLSIPSNSFHGFVKNGVFFGEIEEIKPSVELNQMECCWLKENFIFLHPTVMQICRLKLGDPISINGVRSIFSVGCVWLNNNIQPGFVGISKTSFLYRLFKQEKIVRIERIQSILNLKSIEFRTTLQKSFANTDEFRNFFRCYLQHSYLIENSNVSIPYFGQICEFSSESFTAATNSADDSSNSNLLMNLTNLTLNDESSNESNFMNVSGTDLDNSVISVHSDLNDENYIHLPDKPNIAQVLYISNKTELKFVDCKSIQQQTIVRPTLNDLGGLTMAKTILHDHVVAPSRFFKKHDTLALTNFKARSILLYGPSGCGKTSLIRCLAVENYVNFTNYDSEMSLEFLFSNPSTPHILFADDFDSIFNIKESSSTISENSKQSLSKICQLMDSIEKQSQHSLIFFIAATSKPEKLQNSIRRRFDVEIEISIPNSVERLEILQKILRNYTHSLTDSDLEQISSCAHGFTPSDLAILCKEAGVYSTKRGLTEADDVSKKFEIIAADLHSAFTKVRPSGMREIFLEVPKVYWSDIGGQDRLKLELKQAVEWPLKHADAFIRLGIKPPCGVLMYGPPGCSKTMVAKALATESGLNFLAIKGPELFSKWVGESERAVRDIFRKARQVAPSIIFFDEIDALASDRGSSSGSSNVGDRVLTQLLTELDGVQVLTNVIVVAATNRPDLIDRALLRPGRFDRMVYVPLPDAATRQDILRIQFRKIPVADDVDVGILVDRTDGFSGAELVMLCTEAAMLAMQQSLDADVVKWNHFEQCLKFVKPRTDERLLKIYDEYSLSNMT